MRCRIGPRKLKEASAAVPASDLSPAKLKPHLRRCGYSAAQLEIDYRFDRGTVPLAAFSGEPFDTRSACIVAVGPSRNGDSSIADVRNTGAPVVFACYADRLEWWKQTTTRPERKETVKARHLDGFFTEHKHDFAPKTIYEGKTRRRLPGQTQLHFVDIGVMPMVERTMGDALSRLIGRAIGKMEGTLGRAAKRKADVEKVFKSAFWLLAAKMLRDKQVKNFKTINLTEIDDVFRRVARHYGDTQGLPPGGKPWRAAIGKAADTIEQFGYLGSVSTEALAYLYEDTLVPREVRKALGIHSTPSYVVDYMVWQLWPWIEQIPERDRHVFEPACGHAAFLVGAMRLLRQWSSIGDGRQRHEYLRQHLHGVEIDAFALEIAKLSLTLADIPYGNSWKLTQADMFDKGLLQSRARRCHILLANPPYEKFSASDRTSYRTRGAAVSAQTKAVEMLTRTIPHLPRGGVFGVIVPQGTLHSPEASELRELLVREFEIAEIALFADNLFERSDHETAMILGRRKKPTGTSSAIRYRRVREKGMEAFRERFAFSSEETVARTRFETPGGIDFRVPDLDQLWQYLSNAPRLNEAASLGQGLAFKGNDLPQAAWTIRENPKTGDSLGYANVTRDLAIYSHPPRVAMNLDRSVLLHVRTGMPTGNPQVLINYARVSRGPWRIKAIIDNQGLAVTSRFITVRAREKSCPELYLWALLNSPLANAFVYTHTLKRDILVGMVRELPVPGVSSERTNAVVQAADAYLDLAQKSDSFMELAPSEDSVRQALLRVDAEVLRLYDLPPRLERQLLDLFAGVERKGVGCDFRGYYPEGLDAYVPLHELISEEYQRSTLDAFLHRHEPTESPKLLRALRGAAEAYAEE